MTIFTQTLTLRNSHAHLPDPVVHRIHYRADGQLAIAYPIDPDALVQLQYMIPPASRIDDPEGRALLISAGWAQTAFNLLRTLGDVEIGGEA